MTPSKWVFKSWPLRIAVVMAFLGMVMGAAVFYVHAVRAFKPKPAVPLTPLGELFVTGYEPDKRISDLGTYRLRIYGKVGKEVSLTLDDVKALPAHDVEALASACWAKTGNVRWRGARHRRRHREGPARLRTPDSWCSTTTATSAPASSMDYVRSGKPLLAWGANGQDLPREQGWPLRVVAPGKWGYKWVKWVTAIELTDRGYEGTYEGKGFSLNGDRNGPGVGGGQEVAASECVL